MSKSDLIEAIRRLDRLSRRDPGQRGFSTFADTDHLAAAATELLSGERIILVTGFCIRAAMIGENDGPSGTLALADALRQLGKQVVLVTDKHSAALLLAGSQAFGEPFPTTILSQAQHDADQEIRALLESFHRPRCLPSNARGVRSTVIVTQCAARFSMIWFPAPTCF